MTDWRSLAAVAIGGAAGSLLRYAISLAVITRVGTAFPWATLGINVAGSFCIGVVAELALRGAGGITPLVRVFLAVGVLGGFTTFSSFSLETLALVRGGLVAPALAYAAGSVVLGFGAASLGVWTARGT